MVHQQLSALALAAVILAAWPLNPAISQGPAQLAASPSQPCVLLQNDNVLFGRARQVGEYVIVHKGEGGEIQLDRQQVACWADSPRDLYRYRVDHRQKGDLAAHVRDARWCLRYDLYDLAAHEIRAIRSYDPENAAAKRMEGELQRLTSARTPMDRRLLVRPTSAISPADDDSGSDLGNVDLATLRGFAGHVQPMLINRCARCHSGKPGDVSRWNLVTPPAGSRASSRMTRENLAASLRYIHRSEPEKSLLLIKATTPHGGSDAPLDPRNAKAIASLKTWVAMAGSSAATPLASQPNASHQDVAPPPRIETPAVSDGGVAGRPLPPRGDAERIPARLPQVTNPFDPELFNRRFHSE